MDDLTILAVRPLEQKDRININPLVFNLDTKSACVLHIAPPQSGKTNLIVNLLLNKSFDLINKLDLIHIYSPTISSDESTRHLLEVMPGTIYKDYSDQHLRSILNQQMSFAKSERPRIAIFLDDFICFPNLTKNSLIYKLASQYRHYNIRLLYFSSQFYKAVSVRLRSCINFAIISGNSNEKELMKKKEELDVYDGQFLNFITVTIICQLYSELQ